MSNTIPAGLWKKTTLHYFWAIPLLLFIISGCATVGKDVNTDEPVKSILQRKYNLAGERGEEKRYYYMETNLVHYEEDGSRKRGETYRLYLMCIPKNLSGKDNDKYLCKKFTLQKGNGAEVRIPALDEWSYEFKRTESGLDEEGRIFGIDHAKFENLKDEDGNTIPVNISYGIYNTFVDFHSFCNVFAEKTSKGKGIQDLKSIGQLIVHAAAFSEPPVDLGDKIRKGSKFKNGEVTLKFKGLSVVDDVPCAIVSFDSGESSFNMILRPMPNMEVKVVGGSHYNGDLYIELESKWVRKVVMNEVVVTKVTMGGKKLSNAVIERSTIIKSVREEEFVDN